MNEIVSSQALVFITAIEIGIVMGMIFDLIRVVRKIVKHPNFLVQIEDLFYWIACGLIGFYMLYVNNYAAIRPFVFIGIILGAIFYFATFSIVFMKAATAIINYVKALLRRLWQLFLIPMKWCIKTIKKPVSYVKQQYKNEREKQKIVYRQKLRVKYQQNADKQTDKYLAQKYKKINLEEKRNERLKKQQEELLKEQEMKPKVTKKLKIENKGKNKKKDIYKAQ